jgi:LysM repeat protein
MHGHRYLGLILAVAVLAGCHSAAQKPETSTPAPVAMASEPSDGTVVGNEKTSIEAAIEAGPSATETAEVPRRGIPLADNAPDSYVVKRGDTLWGIAKVFLRDPWYWPEIWQVNPQVQNPHLIYPGDTLRLVYIDGQPQIVLQRGDGVRVEPTVRSEPINSAITTIPYATVAAFMSKPTVLDRDQIKSAPYVLATRDLHVVMSEGDTVYARGFTSPAELGSHYNVVRVGDALIDPDDNRVLGYDGIFTGSGHVTRQGDPTTLIMTESARESRAGDKLIPGGVDVPLDFIPSPPKTKTSGHIIAVSDGVTVIGQYEVVAINRGAADGLAPGNVLAIYESGQVIADNANKGFLSVSHLGAKKVRLPDERTGTFMVFKTFDHLSYGLVMEATNVMHVGDRVGNP